MNQRTVIEGVYSNHETVQSNNLPNNAMSNQDKYFTPPDDGFDYWADKVVDAMTERFYNENEVWVNVNEGLLNKWLNKLFSKNVEPKDAAGIIEQAFNLELTSEFEWILVSERIPEYEEVLGYNEKWIDEDFNPDGIRICFPDGDGNWTSAKWNNEQDHYHTHAEWKCEQGKDFNPTHWRPKPKSPLNSSCLNDERL